MSSVVGKCKKCGIRYGHYSNVESARRNVSQRKCKKGGNCEADV